MEKSESGAPIHRHESRQRDFELAFGDCEHIEQISAHIETHVGPVASVYHELVSDLVHVDVHIVKPTPDRNFYTLVTSGMSERPMSPPEEYNEFRYSELMICLPPTWPMGQSDWKIQENYWPVGLLKRLCRFPHEYEAWLWSMHTLPNGDPPEPYASNTEMTGVILLPPMTTGNEFWELNINSKKTIHFHAVVPLHSDEMDLKLKKGAEALFDGFDRDGLSELLDPERRSTVIRRGLFDRWKKK